MDKKIVWGLGLTIISVFIRYALPTMPSWVAWIGVGVGVGLIMWSAVAWVAGPDKGAAIAPGDTVTSHKQSGGITAHTVNVGDKNVRK